MGKNTAMLGPREILAGLRAEADRLRAAGRDFPLNGPGSLYRWLARLKMEEIFTHMEDAEHFHELLGPAPGAAAPAPQAFTLEGLCQKNPAPDASPSRMPTGVYAIMSSGVRP
jgi:hypothetical protein